MPLTDVHLWYTLPDFGKTCCLDYVCLERNNWNVDINFWLSMDESVHNVLLKCWKIIYHICPKASLKGVLTV